MITAFVADLKPQTTPPTRKFLPCLIAAYWKNGLRVARPTEFSRSKTSN